VLNPTKQTTKYQTQKIMPQLLQERPIAMTRKGLAKRPRAKPKQLASRSNKPFQDSKATLICGL